MDWTDDARKRQVGGIVSSSVYTAYRLGFVRRAAAVVFPESVRRYGRRLWWSGS
jgi:hypothetical protein